MNDQNNRHGKREVSSQRSTSRGGCWQQYKAWVAGLSRGQRIRYRVLQVATAISILIILGFLILSAWIRVPDLPKPPVTGGVDGSGDFSIEGAELPDLARGERKDGIYTFLLVGKDVASGSTDTMLLLSYNTKEKTIQGLNLPRDTMLNVSTNSKRLNAVYSYNKGHDKATQVEKGMAALKKEVANLTGITPDYYVLLEWEAIGELVDALGGVEFEVPFDMDYDDPYQNLHIHQKAGLRKLNGDDAMQVIRHRKNNDGSHSAGDVGRLEIQQDFLKAVAKKCLQPATFLKIPQLAEIFAKNVTTDLSVGNILAFAQMAYGMNPDEGVSFTTAPLAATFRYRGAALVTLDPEGILEIVNGGMNPYQRDIQESDLQVVYKKSNGSFGVTNAALADPKMGQAGAAPKPKPNEPPQEDDEETPIEPLEPEVPVDGSQTGDASQPGSSSQGGGSQTGSSSQAGDVSQGTGDGSQGTGESSSADGSQQPPAEGDGSQSAASSQGGAPSQDTGSSQESGSNQSSGSLGQIDPDQVLPDPNGEQAA